ncbi:MAG: hypothetical protein FJW96_16245 [Actinobacteria bacterium]|nr:hypothetical protein [Actinomycetota bacterium]
MTPGARVSLCGDCGWSGLPERLWCPACESGRMRDARAQAGVVEETTQVRRGGGIVGEASRIGTVRLAGGGTIVARLAPGASEGGRVRLFDDNGATVARPL